MKNNITQLTRTSRTSGFLSALIGMALLATAGSPAFAGDGNVGNPNIMPPQSHPSDLSYAEWAESFWQWTHAGNTINSPQSGPVWFLASTGFKPPGFPPALRTITIPANTFLFTPVSSFYDNNEGVIPPLSDAALIAEANSIYDGVAILTACTIDGVPVKGLENPLTTAYRVQTRVYINPFTLPGPTEEVAVGAFLMIKPLSVGVHTVHVVAAINVGIVLTKDVTYTITVTP